MSLHMSLIHRIRVTWTGMPGAPGISTWYTSAPPAAADLTAIRSFFNSLAAGLPNTLTITVLGVGDSLEETTGVLENVWSATAPATVVGTSASGYGAPVGTVIHWLTGVVVDGRRVKGSTFIVPTVNQYEAGGTPVGTWITTLTTAGNTLIAALGTQAGVWHRPKFGPRPGPGLPRPRIRDGSWEPASSVLVPDKAVVLRSRRD